MSRLNTFYLEPAHWREPFTLDGEEARHLLRVLRAEPGETVRLFNGQGDWGLFRLECAGKKDALFTPLSLEREPEPVSPLTLAMAWSKSTRRGFALEKAVELGAAAIWFWPAKFSQGEPPAETKETWFRQAIAAAKQCGAARLPEIRIFSSQAEMAREAQNRAKILCWEEQHISGAPLRPEDLRHENGCVALIGPEGGIAKEEAEFFQQQGFATRSLGARILRCETAALYVLALHNLMTQLEGIS